MPFAVTVSMVCDMVSLTTLVPPGSDSDEARFRRRKTRSMKKSRRQCLPMNFDPADLAQPVVRDRQRIGASLADIDPMNINREVGLRVVLRITSLLCTNCGDVMVM